VTELELRRFFETWIERLGLQHWTIEIVVARLKPKTTTMRTTKSPNYDRGRVTVQPWVLTGKPPANWHQSPDMTFAEQIEATVIHELLHLLLWETSSAIYLLSEHAKRSAFDCAISVQESREENFVDRLSVALLNAIGPSPLERTG
jgi:hypothetical protein